MHGASLLVLLIREKAIALPVRRGHTQGRAEPPSPEGDDIPRETRSRVGLGAVAPSHIRHEGEHVRVLVDDAFQNAAGEEVEISRPVRDGSALMRDGIKITNPVPIQVHFLCISWSSCAVVRLVKWD